MGEEVKVQAASSSMLRSNAWTDMALVVPIFIAYHLGVVLLKVRNAADLVTEQLTLLAHHHIGMYWALTLAIGFTMVVVLTIGGRGEAFEQKRFFLVVTEGVLYAFLMRTGALYVVGRLPLAGGAEIDAFWSGVIMSLGAGFYEELIFRVALFGGGVLVIKAFFGVLPRLLLVSGWVIVAAAVFAGWHYVGPLADAWNIKTFMFRLVCGVMLTLVYKLRGFAPAVWTHVLYDVWALALHG